MSTAKNHYFHELFFPSLYLLPRHFSRNCCFSSAVGIFGYHKFAGLAWVDATVNAAMILGGMGPVNELNTAAGKLFAAAHALFSGLVFLIALVVLLAPVIHRFLNRFHVEVDSDSSTGN